MSKYTSQSGIYVITHIKSGKIYIGQAEDIRTRWLTHKASLNGNRHSNSHLQRAWNKYGEKAFKFQILEYCPIDQLDEREQHYLDVYMPKDMCYNIAVSVDSPTRGRKLSEEHKRKIGLSHIGKGHPISEETKRKLKETSTGKRLSEASRVKLSNSKKGHSVSPETRKKLSKANMGKKQHLGFKHSDEAKRKMSLSHAKMTSEIVEEIRHKYASGGTSYSKLAKEYGISSSMVGFIVRRERRTIL